MGDVNFCPKCGCICTQGTSTSTLVHPGPNTVRTSYTCDGRPNGCRTMFVATRKDGQVTITEDPEVMRAAPVTELGGLYKPQHTSACLAKPAPWSCTCGANPNPTHALTCRGCGITGKQRQVSSVTSCCPPCEELRDRFAGHALVIATSSNSPNANSIAKDAYILADAMLEARKTNAPVVVVRCSAKHEVTDGLQGARLVYACTKPAAHSGDHMDMTFAWPQ